MTYSKWPLVVVILLFVIVTIYLGSPYFAAIQLRTAARTGDRDQLEQAIDFPAVRENLKSQLSTSLMKSISSDPAMANNPFAALGGMLAPALTDRIVDSVVTPDGLANMIQRGRYGTSESSGGPAIGLPRANYSYRTMDRFRMEITGDDPRHQPLSITLERRGLISWKVIRIDLPDDAFKNPQQTRALVPNETMPRADSPPQVQQQPNKTMSTQGHGCYATALTRVPVRDSADSFLAPNEIDNDITQYIVGKHNGSKTFCSHGGSCYPRFIDGKEALRLENCSIGNMSFEDEESTTYSMVIDRAKVSADVVRQDDVTDAVGKWMCRACASNAARYYIEQPASQCALVVKGALEGNPDAQQTLQSNPDYCRWRNR